MSAAPSRSTARPVTVAVARTPGADFTIEEATLAPPGPREVLVRIAGVGICHTDLIARDQFTPFPLPAVLGHEGAGVVEEVGSEVASVRPGDHVVLSFDSCGVCPSCSRAQPAYCREFYLRNFSGLRGDGAALRDAAGEALTGRFFGQSSFASHALAAERSVVKIADDVPLELMGPLGCGVQTGAGAVLNVLRPQEGASLAIFGAGSVGLAALLAAKVAGCGEMILIDRNARRLALARELGATVCVDPSDGDVVEAVRRATAGGADFSLECTGVPAVLRHAVDCLNVPGMCGVVGAPPFGAEVSLDITSLLLGRTVRGVIEGDSVPQDFIPKLIELWRQGLFPFDRLITAYALDEINLAVRDVHAGHVLKPIVRP